MRHYSFYNLRNKCHFQFSTSEWALGCDICHHFQRSATDIYAMTSNNASSGQISEYSANNETQNSSCTCKLDKNSQIQLISILAVTGKYFTISDSSPYQEIWYISLGFRLSLCILVLFSNCLFFICSIKTQTLDYSIKVSSFMSFVLLTYTIQIIFYSLITSTSFSALFNIIFYLSDILHLNTTLKDAFIKELYDLDIFIAIIGKFCMQW